MLSPKHDGPHQTPKVVRSKYDLFPSRPGQYSYKSIITSGSYFDHLTSDNFWCKLDSVEEKKIIKSLDILS